MKKLLKQFLILVIIVLSVIALYWFFENIYYPSKLSYLHSCKLITDEQLNNAGYCIAGNYTDNINISLGQVGMFVLNPDKKTIRHELVHKIQMDRGFFYPCSQKMWRITNEMEAYTMSNLGSKVLNFIYHTNIF